MYSSLTFAITIQPDRHYSSTYGLPSLQLLLPRQNVLLQHQSGDVSYWREMEIRSDLLPARW